MKSDSSSVLFEMISELSEASYKDFPNIIKSHPIGYDDVKELACWEEDEYARVCLYRDDKFEVLLLCWMPGDNTPIHGHDGQRCWVYQVSGEIQESIYKLVNERAQLVSNTKISSGCLSYMDDKMGLHTLNNNSDKKALTLHIYASPIDSCLVFNEEEECFESKELSYVNEPLYSF